MIRPPLLARLTAALATSLLAASLAAEPCAEPPAGGIGGSSAPARGGIGGTGAPLELAAGGIGGTGAPILPISAGESGAVVGTITGFASICVNGLEVHYADASPVSINGRLADTTSLAVGQVVALEVGQGSRGLEAARIHVVHAVVGPVSRHEDNAIIVMGQRVLVGGLAAVPSVGATVRVSGLRDADGNIVASRVDSADAEAEHSVVGRVRGGRIGALEIDTTELPDETDVLVRGHYAEGRLRAREIQRDPAREVGERARAISLETRAIETRGSRLTASGRPLAIDDDTRLVGGKREDVGRNRLVRLIGRVDSQGTLHAERLELRRDAGREARDERQDSGRSGSGRRDRSDRDRSGRSGSGGDDKRIERIERGDRPERAEAPERIERVETH